MGDRYFAFISHASPDRPVADALLAALEQRGLACWIATRDTGTGANYGKQILQAICDASVLVLIFSVHSNNSEDCQREVERARHYKRRIFPIRIDSSVPTDSMEYHLSVVQWLEAQGENDWAKVAGQLKEAFDRTSTETGSPPGHVKPYPFGGKDYYSAEQLAVALSENWDAGVKDFGRGFVSDWVKVDLRNFDLATRLLDIQGEKDLTVEEKLSVALVKMNPKLPAVWRGDVVNREWATRAMEEFKALLQSRIRPRLEKLNGWPDDLVKQLAKVKSEKLSPEHLAAVERMVLSGDGRLILNGRKIDEELLQGDPALGAELLNGKLPKLCVKYGDPGRWKQWMSRWAIVKDLEEQQIAVLYPAVISEKRGPKVGNRLLTIDWLEANLAEGRRLLSKADFCQAHSALTGEEWLLEAGQRWRGAVRMAGKQAEWLWSWACTTKPELKQEGAALTQQQLASNAIEGVLLLEGQLPGFWAEKTGETWLAEAAARWKQSEPMGVIREYLQHWAFTGEAVLKDGGTPLNTSWLGAHPKEAMMVLESPLPEFWAKTTSQTWLAEVAEEWMNLQPQVKALGCGISKLAALPWIIAPSKTLAAETQRRLQQYAGAINETLNRFWENGQLDAAQRIALCATEERNLLTPEGKAKVESKAADEAKSKAADEAKSKAAAEAAAQAKYARESLHYLKCFGAKMDWNSARKWIWALDSNHIRELWREACSSSLASSLKLNPQLAQVMQAETPSGLDVLAVCLAYVHEKEIRKEEERLEIERKAAQRRKVERRWKTVVMLLVIFMALFCLWVAVKTSKATAERAATQARIKWTGAAMRRAGFPEATITKALTKGGTVVAWGSNGNGQTTVPAGLSGVVAIAAGHYHTVALKADGAVVAWGSNGSGQTDVPAGLTGVVAIAAGEGHTVALKADGAVVAWGSNGSGQTDVPAGLTGVVAIAAGEGHTVALKADGTVEAWGGKNTVPAGLTGVVAIAAGYQYTVVLKADGTVEAWGGKNTVPAGLTGVVAIAAGGHHAVALKADGKVVGWGSNFQNQLAIPAGLTGVVAIAAGYQYTVVLKADGTVEAWGDNDGGQTDVPAGLTGVVAIAAGSHHAVALKLD